MFLTNAMCCINCTVAFGVNDGVKKPKIDNLVIMSCQAGMFTEPVFIQQDDQAQVFCPLVKTVWMWTLQPLNQMSLKFRGEPVRTEILYFFI